MKRLALYLTQPDARLVRDSGGLAVSIDGKVSDKWPTADVSRVLVFGNAQVTTQALALLFSVGASVSYFSSTGRYRGQLVSPESGNVFVRLAQHRRHSDPAFRLNLAKQLVTEKLRAGRRLVVRYAQNHSDAAPQLDPTVGRLDYALSQVDGVSDLDALLGLEGSAAASYFQALGHMIRPPFAFSKRSQNPGRDPPNALLNLGYTLLSVEIAGRLESAGFDPRIGYYHGIRYGRHSLALDLLEAHRVDVVDRLLLSVLNRRMFTPQDFTDGGEQLGVRLTPPALRRFLGLYESALGEPATTDGTPSARQRIEAQVSDLRRAVLSGDPLSPDRDDSEDPAAAIESEV
jgi:CRISPR-associated protein Cas1